MALFQLDKISEVRTLRKGPQLPCRYSASLCRILRNRAPALKTRRPKLKLSLINAMQDIHSQTGDFMLNSNEEMTPLEKYLTDEF